MSSIGPYSVFSIRDPLPRAHLVMEDITRPGVAGKAFQVTGLHGSAQTIEVFSPIGSVNVGLVANGLMTAFTNLEGSVVTIVDDFGQSRGNFMVKAVDEVRKDVFSSATELSASAVYGWLVTSWTIEDVSTA